MDRAQVRLGDHGRLPSKQVKVLASVTGLRAGWSALGLDGLHGRQAGPLFHALAWALPHMTMTFMSGAHLANSLQQQERAEAGPARIDSSRGQQRLPLDSQLTAPSWGWWTAAR